MQDSAGQTFKDGRKWIDLAEGLKNGSVNPADVPPIRIWKDINNKLWSLDTRRLAAFEYAGIDAPYVWASKHEIDSEIWKMTTGNNGLSVLIRGLKIVVGK